MSGEEDTRTTEETAAATAETTTTTTTETSPSGDAPATVETTTTTTTTTTASEDPMLVNPETGKPLCPRTVGDGFVEWTTPFTDLWGHWTEPIPLDKETLAHNFLKLTKDQADKVCIPPSFFFFFFAFASQDIAF